MGSDINKSLLSKTVFAGVTSGVIFTSLSFPFFYFITYSGNKKDGTSRKNRIKWFQLRHTKVNHPRDRYEDEYLSSRAWCEQQTMQDVYIRSLDGLRLHGSFFPADKPERIVMLCHGYRGTSFGSVAHIAEYLHRNNSSLLFIR
ncbi:MAG: hypothetical protein Q4G47_03445 [Lachnospiraceae bacterium]|nr:hypothetical protein [Lachnospiraceae bacterium]